MTAPLGPEPPPALSAAAARGVGWTVLRSVTSHLVGSAVFVVLARLLDPVAFGTVALASVFVLVLTLLVEAGFAEALVQRRSVSAADLDTAFWLSNALGLALAGLLFAGADLLSALFAQLDLAPVLRVLAVVPLLAGLSSVPQALLKRDLSFRLLALRGLVATVAGGAVGIGLAVGGAGVWALVGQVVATTAASTLVLWLACDWRPGRQVSRASLRDLLAFSWRVLGGRLALLTSRRSDDFLVGLVLGPVVLGLYAVAYRLLLLITELVIWTVESVAFPLLSRLHGDAARTRRAFYGMTEVCAAAAVPAFLGLAVLAPEIVRVAFGQQWTGAIPILQVLALVGLPHVVTYCSKAALNAGGRPDLTLRVALVTGAVNLLAFACVVRWGVVAVAASYVVCAYVLAPVSLHLVRQVVDLQVRSYLRLLAGPVAAGLVMTLVLVALTRSARGALSDPVVLGLAVPIGAAAYLATLALTARRLLAVVVAQVRSVLR